MSWDTVNTAITFSAPINPFGLFSQDEQQTIRDIIKVTYNLSPTLNNLLEAWTSSEHQINIYKTGPLTPGQGGAGNGLLGLNLDAMSHTFFFNRTGHLVSDIPNLIIAHELFHAIRNTEDLVGTGPFGIATNADLNNPSFDYDGETVPLQNDVANDLGLYYWNQVSYESGISDNNPRDSRFSQLRTDISYSDNQVINIVRFGDRGFPQSTPDFIDFSQRTDGKNIVAFGFGGNDTILGESGSNFLYGGPGDDTL
jgi:hypothetical protein